MMNIAETIIRDVCETDPADPGSKDTICINVDDLRVIIDNNLDPTQGADARPVAIYQGRVVGDTRWDDLSKDAHDHMQNKPQIFETRIVYATRDAAPTRYGYVYEWDYSPGVVHRSFDCAPYNGRQPDRTVEVFRAAIAPRGKT